MARPRSFDQERVLDGAMEVFRERGYDGASVPELTQRLGICRQSLYTVFGDKRGLYLRALERWGQREVDAKLALLEAPGAPLDNLRTVLRGLAAHAAHCPGEGCLTAKAIAENRGDAEALAVVEGHVARLEAGFRTALERAQRDGALLPGARPARLARAFVTACYGIGVLARLPSSGPRIGDSVAVLLDLLDAASA